MEAEMSRDSRSELGETIRQHRVMRELTLQALSKMSGVCSSHLGRIERGERFPSARILRKIAKPLGLAESNLFASAGYLSPQPTAEVETPTGERLDPYVTAVLSQEPLDMQRAVVGILSVLKSIAQARPKMPTEWPEFREYAHRKYPQLDEASITMIEDVLEHPPKGTEVP
jgi:transcriptional regulator with XRE-family HTH domain